MTWELWGNEKTAFLDLERKHAIGEQSPMQRPWGENEERHGPVWLKPDGALALQILTVLTDPVLMHTLLASVGEWVARTPSSVTSMILAGN